MEDYFEINVSKNGKHLFATSPYSLPAHSDKSAIVLYELFRDKFPENEGFEIRVTKWVCRGQIIIGKY